MDALTLASLNDKDTVIVTIIGVCGGITLFSLFVNLALGLYRTREVERSRREIAAYIAEGSMTPDEGERLLKADPGGKPKSCGWAGMWGSCGKKA